MEDKVRKKPSVRNCEILASRTAGNALQKIAEDFEMSAGRARLIERETRDYAEATQSVKHDPDNILLLARTGQLVLSAAYALDKAGIRHIQDLKGSSLRSLLMLPNMSRRGAERIVLLASEREIEIKS